jgi:hypothetical protein
MSNPNQRLALATGGIDAIIAQRAKNALQPPANTLVVDLAYTNSSATWQFGNVADALAYARAEGGAWRIVVGFGFVLPENEDIYDLMDAGIFVEFSVDPWKNYILLGGDIAESDMKYTVSESKLNITIKG